MNRELNKIIHEIPQVQERIERFYDYAAKTHNASREQLKFTFSANLVTPNTPFNYKVNEDLAKELDRIFNA